MYFLNNDGTLDKNNVDSINVSPMQVDVIEVKSTSDIIEPNNNMNDTLPVSEPYHIPNCKCMKCFVRHNVSKYGKTCTNIFYLIVFLIIMYLVYMLLLKVFV